MDQKELLAKRKLIYNYDSNEDIKKCTIIGGNPNGIMSFNQTPHKWANELYRAMLDRTWFATQVNVSKDKTNYPMVPENIRWAYDRVLSQLITNDSIQTNQLMDSINQYITSPIVNACLSRQSFEECMVPETEVLRDDGRWVRLDELEVGDRILAANENMVSYFTPVTNIASYNINTTMHHYHGRYFEQIVTKMHRMPIMDKNFILHIKPSINVYQMRGHDNILSLNMISHAPSFINNNTSRAVLPILGNLPSWDEGKWYTLPWTVKLAIALQADGSTSRMSIKYSEELGRETSVRKKETYNNRTVSFSFSKERKIKKLIQILNALKIKPTMNTQEKGGNVLTQTTFSFQLPESMVMSKVFYDMYDLNKFTMSSAREFIDEILCWDGWDYGNNTVGYDTTVKANADFVMAVGTIAGYRMSMSIDKDDRKETYSDLYRIRISKAKLFSSRGTVTVNEIPYNGKVYCPTVYGGLFICRYNNKVSLTGNSLHAQSYSVMAEDICQDTDRIYELYQHDEELFLKNKAVADMYSLLYQGTTPSNEDLLVAFAANQVLEELVFPGGFAFFYAIESYFPGSAEMIAEIDTLSLVA